MNKFNEQQYHEQFLGVYTKFTFFKKMHIFQLFTKVIDHKDNLISSKINFKQLNIIIIHRNKKINGKIAAFESLSLSAPFLLQSFYAQSLILFKQS